MPGRRLPKARAGMVRAGMVRTGSGRARTVRAGTAWTAAAIAVVVMASGGAAMAHDGYRVRPGDTLSAVATRMGVDPGRLAAANGLADPNRIFVGQVLKTPSVATTPSAGSTASSGTYKVRPGDTLSRVAPRLGVPVAQLASANSLSNPNNIIAGRSLVVPTAAATVATPSGDRASTTPSPPQPRPPRSRSVRRGSARCRAATSSTTTAMSSLVGRGTRASTCTHPGSPR